METQNRLKSPVFWSGVFAQIVALLLFMGVISVTDAQVIEKIVAIGLMVYGAFPMANDPTSKNKF
jgi:uncharacterized membrane protein